MNLEWHIVDDEAAEDSSWNEGRQMISEHNINARIGIVIEDILRKFDRCASVSHVENIASCAYAVENHPEIPNSMELQVISTR